jgi:hypothetical protein
MRFTRAGLAFLGALALGSCGANGPFGLNPQPSGGYVVTSQQTGKVLNTSLANPFIVSGGSFAIQVTEPHLSGPPNARITAWTAPFNIPCFVPHLLPGTDVFQFTADNAAPISNPTQINPCSPFAVTGGFSTSEETVTFTDNHGNTGNFYYQIAGSTTTSGGGGGGTGSASNTVASIALSWDGTVPTTGGTCGAYLLTVTAFDSAGAQIIGQTYTNPITLSTSDYFASGFSTATAGVIPAPPPAAEDCLHDGVNPGGSPSLVVPDTNTPSVVYFKPINASGSTIITATAIGATQINTTITISNVAKKPLSIPRK